MGSTRDESTARFLSLNRAHRSDHLDLVRGVASLLVLAGHSRAFVFQNYANLPADQVGLFVKAFYFVTGLGHEAVIVFFALSGFLVGGNALDHLVRQQFAWPNYLARRLTRLWIVILPALALTFVLDTIGSMITGGIGYDGRYYDLFASGPRPPTGSDHSLPTLLGNMAFLQTLFVPTFGSNGPMWSLANEFWYYVVFPLITWLFLARVAASQRLFGATILAALIWVLPTSLLEGGLIWVAGAAAGWCSQGPSLRMILRNRAMLLGAMAVLTGALATARVLQIGDLTIGVAVALSLPFIAHAPSSGPGYAALSRALSDLSYTLDLTHFPFLTLIVFCGLAPQRLTPSLGSAALYVGLLTTAIVWAIAFWWLFERNTNRVYLLLSRTWLAPRERHAG
jgi:peptidoglycan/LPS O-acetylase OafA/YrhL